MSKRIASYRKAQAIVEIGVLGSLLLLITLQLLSYAQRLNDQQYLTMKTFRDGLHKAYFNTEESGDGSETYSKGGSVTLNKIEHRRQAAGDFSRKGQRAIFSSGTNIYWGVPFINYEIGDEEVTVSVDNLDHFELYNINDQEYSFIDYYDIDGDGENDWIDEDIDGDGILNIDDDDANGDGIDDEFAAEHSGIDDDLDGDGIPNWRDDDANGNGINDKDEGPRIELVMNYQEAWQETRQRTESPSAVTSRYALAPREGSAYSERVEINFYDRREAANRILGDGDDVLLDESDSHYLTFEEGKYKYIPGEAGVNRSGSWSTSK